MVITGGLVQCMHRPITWQDSAGSIAMLRYVRRSLLIQLLSMYLLFVVIVLLGGVEVNAVVEQQQRNDVQASDQALAQEIALHTSIQLSDAEQSIVQLGNLAEKARSLAAIQNILSTYRAARSDADQVYWLDPFGQVLICLPCYGNVQPEFSPPNVIQQAARQPRLHRVPVFEVGIAEETPLDKNSKIPNAGVIIAYAVHDASTSDRLIGFVAANISLNNLSIPLGNVVQAQRKQGRQLMISIIDDQGDLVATPDHKRILFAVLDKLPGADQALQGHVNSSLGPGPDGSEWLFSSVPVPGLGWAVVVQRPTSEALAVVGQLHLWLLFAALLFAIGGLLFWLILLCPGIRPLQHPALQHQALPTSEQSIPVHATVVAERDDEVGDLARSLVRLERDGLEKLGELRTLLETSNAVVRSLEPHAVVGKIMREVRRLVDVQAAAVLLPDEQGVLRVLASDGHSKRYDHSLSLSPENVSSAAVLALSSGKPVQKLLTPEQPVPSFSYDEGFRSV